MQLLKIILRGWRLHRSREPTFYNASMNALVNHWQKCIATAGVCFHWSGKSCLIFLLFLRSEIGHFKCSNLILPAIIDFKGSLNRVLSNRTSKIYYETESKKVVLTVFQECIEYDQSRNDVIKETWSREISTIRYKYMCVFLIYFNCI